MPWMGMRSLPVRNTGKEGTVKGRASVSIRYSIIVERGRDSVRCTVSEAESTNTQAAFFP